MKRVLVDTNLILRYLLDGDDLLPKLSKDNLIWLRNEVILETAFVMMSVYKMSRRDIFDLVTSLLMKPNADSERVILFDTFSMFRDTTSISLVDSFLFNLAKQEKIELITYDKKLAKKLVK